VTEADLRRAAVERAYRDHADDVYRIAYAILREPESASDMTHEAFARAYERWEQYDSARPIGPWLHRIVANAALDHLRRQRVRAITVSLRADPATTRATGIEGDPAGTVERRRLIDDGLASLKPEARAAVVLRHYYGYDYREIGSVLGTSSGNVGSMLSRAHAALRARLAAAAEEPDAERHRRAAP
jgi:RNA polymerase sigma-70 factor (ECF subfamily)